MNEKLVTLAEFSLAVNAEMARVALEAEGIPCIVQQASQMGHPSFIFSAWLQVFEADVEDARDVLEKVGLYKFE